MDILKALEKLQGLRFQLDLLINELEALQKPVARPTPPPPPSPPPAPPEPAFTAGTSVSGGILKNPHIGGVEKVTEKSLTGRNGPFTLYELHVLGAKIGTTKKADADFALNAGAQGYSVSIEWRSRANGKFVNYDLVKIALAHAGIGRANG